MIIFKSSSKSVPILFINEFYDLKNEQYITLLSFYRITECAMMGFLVFSRKKSSHMAK